ncbi:Formylglycine-generating enzyme, required for sulfatase activity, contains SUMF1/FGE domain [Flagellimonas taeanensis]|uniref:Formylglycine-generating enzyme, required for sulfatase activity, contains SUMF1/FGE domain n=1 Tax=Flagellimonas taeanensis TaxID=1005926 RepID=A0A1M6Z4I2_9FLAO|nr:SUMF1/EgtB/PvdO family nonheme iron enzyme [Allomuricauda taeanensis]SFC11805.1 Formylglycine-generating enzyme, required for sulfatase activity, contains SUMF1/FGE domain [Allomuricauda taeanensis]SHL25287.1 Formylglycine-generating enzyme, required for sulfatase activity, contains SUMF1/FGE domain [Allomuricauda taeanensis]
MNRVFVLIVLSLIYGKDILAQETIARFKYEDAEKAFVAENYQACIDNLNEAEKLLGKSAPNILHLKILAQHKLFEKNPFESYEALETLRNNCNTYLANYDIAGLEEKYRDVYDILNDLGTYPVTKAEFEQKTNALNDEKQRKMDGIITKVDSLSPMVFVEGGSFMMGGKVKDSPSIKDTQPEHRVTISSFYIGKYEVTQKLWKYVMGNNPSKFRGCDDCPVESVSWDDALAFIKKLNVMSGRSYRLPSEAEWEYAARGGLKNDGAKHVKNPLKTSWNVYNGYQNKPESLIETRKNKPVPHPIGLKEPNELGLYDMIGNVMEWTNDWYDADYYSKSPGKDPKGPDTGSEKVLRGGSYQTFLVSDFIPRIAGQLKSNISSQIDKSSYGFRLAMDKE